MNQTILPELNRAAQTVLQQQESHAAAVANTIATRQKNNTQSALIARLSGTAILGIGLLILSFTQAGSLHYLGSNSRIFLVLGIVSLTLLCGLLIFRQVHTMHHYKAVFAAGNEVSRIRTELSTRISTLPDKLSSATAAADNNWDLPITLAENTSTRLQNLEHSVVGKADLESKNIDRFLVLSYYLAVTLFGLLVCLVTYTPILNAVLGALEMINGWFDINLSRAAPTVSVIILAIGFLFQYWPTALHANATDNRMFWWSPLMLLSAVVTCWLSFLAVLIIALLICAVVAIVMVVVYVVLGILAIVFGFSLLGGLFGGG